MNDYETQQFLDLIAENTQMKEEIKSIIAYRKLVLQFDQEISKACMSQILNDSFDTSGLEDMIAKLHKGMKSVRSADTWKLKLQKEIIQKSNMDHRSVCENLMDKRESSLQQIDDLEKDIENLRKKITKSQNTCQNAESIRDKLNNEIKNMSLILEKTQNQIASKTAEVESEQAINVQLKCSMEKTHDSISKFMESNSAQSSQASFQEAANKIKFALGSVNLNSI